MSTVNIGNCITPRISSRHVAKVLVPAGGLFAGQVVNAKDLATDATAIVGKIPFSNYEIYAATQPAGADLADLTFAMVMNDGFETLPDGRRPGGQPDYTNATYAYKEGDIATVVFLDAHLTFEVSVGSVTNGTVATPSEDIGKFLIPADGSYALAVSGTAPDGSGLRILGVRNFPVGGLFGGQFETTYICVAV